MKNILLYGVAATCVVHSAVMGQVKSQTIVLSANEGTPHIVFSTNITTKSTSVSSGGSGSSSVMVKVFNANGEEITSKEAGTEQKSTWLGVSTEAVDDVLRSQLSLDSGAGLTVHGVIPDSPAAKAGLMKNDILIRYNDQLLMEPGQLSKLVQAKKSGDRVKLTYLRKGKEVKTEVTLDEHVAADNGNVQVLNLGDMGGPVNVNVSELLKGVKLDDTNFNAMIEAAVKALEQGKGTK